MGVLAGEGISRYLPKDFVPEGVISLYSLRLALPKSFSSIHYFQIAVNFHFEWKISQTPELTLHDMTLTYEYDPYSKFFGMTGSINFLGTETLVCAGVVLPKGQEDVRWQFVWRMCEDESVSITDFVQKIVGFLGVPKTRIALPRVELSQVQVVYDAGNFSFYTKITTGGVSAVFLGDGIGLCIRTERGAEGLCGRTEMEEYYRLSHHRQYFKGMRRRRGIGGCPSIFAGYWCPVRGYCI